MGSEMCIRDRYYENEEAGQRPLHDHDTVKQASIKVGAWGGDYWNMCKFTAIDILLLRPNSVGAFGSACRYLLGGSCESIPKVV